LAKVLIICGDLPPFPGCPGSGAGLRAFGLGRGLQTKGHQVTWAVPREAIPPGTQPPAEVAGHLFRRPELNAFIASRKPETVIFQHWTMLFGLKPIDFPTVIDLHGPTLLETLFQGRAGLNVFQVHKVHAFRRADFFTCAGELQKHYWYPWLLLAEHDLRQEIIATVPLSLSPDLPERRTGPEPTLVYGGFYLPWQDPVWALARVVAELERRKKGRLLFFGGRHPRFQGMDSGVYDQLEAELKSSPRVEIKGVVSRKELLEHYAKATAAVDLMARNPERELAFNSRTVEYLWAGLPVIHQPWSELAGLIRDHQAGWLVEVGDEAGLGKALEELFQDPEAVAARSRNARELVRRHLTWERTIDPLDRFVRSPRIQRPVKFELRIGLRRSLGRSFRSWAGVYRRGGPGELLRRLAERARSRS